MAIKVTNTNLDEVLAAKNITVLDFWAPWCGPCLMLGPIIDELSKDYADNDKISIGKVNVDENAEISLKYGIRGIPTVMFFRDGKEIDKLVGANSKGTFQAKIKELLS